jgi:hypothetical protein
LQIVPLAEVVALEELVLMLAGQQELAEQDLLVL